MRMVLYIFGARLSDEWNSEEGNGVWTKEDTCDLSFDENAL